MESTTYNRKFTQWAIMIMLALIWGSSFILIKRGLDSFSAIQVGALRVSITFLCLVPFALWKLKGLKKSHILYIAIAGFIGNGIPAFLFAKAQTGLDSQIAGMLNATSPLFTLLVGVLFFRYKSKWYNTVGVLIGLVGAIGLLYTNAEKSFAYNLEYGGYIIIATLMYAININVVKKYLKDADSLTILSFAFVSIGPFALAYLFMGTDFTSRLENPMALESLGYLAILAIIGTAFSVFMYYYLLKISTILFTASVTYLIPVIAIIWGIFDGERFYFGYFLWIMLIFAGVFLVNKQEAKKEIQVLK